MPLITASQPSSRRRWWALAALGVSMLAVGVDATVLNLALPTLARSLSASLSELQWFVDAYSLVLAALLLPAGLIGDRYGRKRVLLAALAVFGVASIACALCATSNELIAARAALGLGAAFLMPLSLAVLPVLFPDDDDRRRAMAAWTAFNAVSFPIGPILGGFLLGHFHWGAVFLINVPVVVIAVVAVVAFVPESKSERRPSVDVAGILASSLALVALTYGVIEGGDKGFDDVHALVPLGASAVAAAAFVIVERRRRAVTPLVDLSLFSSASFTWGTVLATLTTFAMFGVLFTVPQYLQNARHQDAMESGLRLLPLIGGLFLGAGAGGRVAKALGAHGDRLIVAAGFLVLGAGLTLGGQVDASSGEGFVLTFITVVGAGLGLALPVAMGAALGALSAERSGAGSALIMALRQAGGTIGVAVLGAVVAHVSKAELAAGAQPLDAFVSGMGEMLEVCAVVAVAGGVVGAAFLPRRSGAVVVSAPAG